MKDKVSIIVSSILILFGASLIVFSLLYEFSLFFLIMGGFFFFGPIILINNQQKQIVPSENKTFEWYKEKYPDNVRGEIITCFTCENNSLNVRALNNEIFQKEIYCMECGKTLYYL